jgi:hypothetical protein
MHELNFYKYDIKIILSVVQLQEVCVLEMKVKKNYEKLRKLRI